MYKLSKQHLKDAINQKRYFQISHVEKDLPTIHKQISFPNIFLNSLTQFFTCKKNRGEIVFIWYTINLGNVEPSHFLH